MNNINLVGNLTKDPIIKDLETGNKVCNFSIAVNDGEQTDFINCVCWNKLAENLCKYQKKGQKIAIVGKLKSREYTNTKNEKKVVHEVLCNEIEYISSKSKQESANSGIVSPKDTVISDSDLPF